MYASSFGKTHDKLILCQKMKEEGKADVFVGLSNSRTSTQYLHFILCKENGHDVTASERTISANNCKMHAGYLDFMKQNVCGINVGVNHMV